MLRSGASKLCNMERIYRPDQEILDARGIDLTVAEVVELSTTEYGDRLRRLNLTPHDAAFVKCLRRRIKNRMASQNSRRRTAEHIRSLTAQLSAVRAHKTDVVERRLQLMEEHALWTTRLRQLRGYIAEKLTDRGDTTPLPSDTEPRDRQDTSDKEDCDSSGDKFECRLESLVARSVQHMYRYERRSPAIDAILDFRKYSVERDLKEEKDFREEQDMKTNTDINRPHSKDDIHTDASIEENILNEREEVAKTLQLLATYRPKTDLEKAQDLSNKEPVFLKREKKSLKEFNFLEREPKFLTKQSDMLKTDPKFSTKELNVEIKPNFSIKQSGFLKKEPKSLTKQNDFLKRGPNFSADSLRREPNLFKKESHLITKDPALKIEPILAKDFSQTEPSIYKEPVKFIKAKCVQVDTEQQIKTTTKSAEKDVNCDVEVTNVRKRKRAVKKRSCIMHTSDVEYESCFSNRNPYLSSGGDMKGEVLNLSLKPTCCPADVQRRHHGRKQAAPRRLTLINDDDAVLDLKMK